MVKHLLVILLLFGPSQSIAQELRKPSPEDAKIRLIQGINLLAFEMYNQLKSDYDNFAFSPFSLADAMSIPYLGAAGLTKNQIRSVMHYPEERDDVQTLFSQLMANYDSSVESFRMLWVQRGNPILPDFAKFTRQADLKRYPETSRDQINAWAREITHYKQIDLISSKEIANIPYMTLLNIFLLNDEWEQEFNPRTTRSLPFFPSSSITKTVPSMRSVGNFAIGSDASVTILELNYKLRKGKSQLALWIVLPNEHVGLAELEKNLSLDRFQKWGTLLKIQKKEVYVPKFNWDKTVDLENYLIKAGLPLPFSDQANFSKISSSKPFKLSKVLQKCRYFINENGTNSGLTSTPNFNENEEASTDSPATLFQINHPFMFFVLDKETKMIFMMGKISNP